MTTYSTELTGSSAAVGRSAVKAATSSAKAKWSAFGWSKKIAAVALAGYLGLSTIGSWIDEPEDGRRLQPDSDGGSPACDHKVIKGNKVSKDYVSGLKEGLLLGSDD